MTDKHDFKAAREYFDIVWRQASGVSIEYNKTIDFALRLAEKLMDEPSMEMSKAGSKIIDFMPTTNAIFKSMRDQLIKEVENG